MKITFKKISFLVLSSLLVFATSCASDESKAEEVTLKFLNSINEGDFKSAIEISDKKTGAMLTMVEGMVSGSEEAKAKIQKDKKDLKLKVIKTVVADTSAQVTYVDENSTEKKEQTMDLVKQDGKWLVSVDKEKSKKEGSSNSNSTSEAEVPEATTEENTDTTH